MAIKVFINGNLFDAATAPEGEPDTIVVGDFVQWKRTDLVEDYPTDDYTVQIHS